MKKNIVILCSFFLSILSCNSEENDSNLKHSLKTESSASAKLVGNTQQEGYKGQLPFIDMTSNDSSDIINFTIDNKDKISSENNTWSDIDSLYSDNASIGVRQYIAYVVLAKKDLIADFKQAPDRNKIEKINFYTNVLIDSENKGYCLLYECLNVLANQNIITVDTASLKQAIVSSYDDATKELFLTQIQTLQNNSDPQSQMLVNKIKENLTFIDQIENL